MVLFNFIPTLFKTFYHRNIKGRIKSWKDVEFNATHYLEVETKANISIKWLIWFTCVKLLSLIISIIKITRADWAFKYLVTKSTSKWSMWCCCILTYQLVRSVVDKRKRWTMFFELCAVVFSTAGRSNCGRCRDTYRQLHWFLTFTY